MIFIGDEKKKKKKYTEAGKYFRGAMSVDVGDRHVYWAGSGTRNRTIKRIFVSLAPSYLRTSYIPANKALSANHLTSTSPSEVSFCSAGATWDEINPADSGSLFRMGVRASNDFATLNRTLGMESSFNSRTTGRTFSLTISVGRTFATVWSRKQPNYHTGPYSLKSKRRLLTVKAKRVVIRNK